MRVCASFLMLSSMGAATCIASRSAAQYSSGTPSWLRACAPRSEAACQLDIDIVDQDRVAQAPDRSGECRRQQVAIVERVIDSAAYVGVVLQSELVVKRP